MEKREREREKLLDSGGGRRRRRRRREEWEACESIDTRDGKRKRRGKNRNVSFDTLLHSLPLPLLLTSSLPLPFAAADFGYVGLPCGLASRHFMSSLQRFVACESSQQAVVAGGATQQHVQHVVHTNVLHKVKHDDNTKWVNNYVKVKKLGEGSFGKVSLYLNEHKKRFAIKVRINNNSSSSCSDIDNQKKGRRQEEEVTAMMLHSSYEFVWLAGRGAGLPR